MPALKRSPLEQRLSGESGPEFLEALARGLRVIEAFNRGGRQLTLSDIARLVDLPRASVRRILHTLVKLDYAEHTERVFRLTPQVLTLARAYLKSNAVADIVQPAIERLSEATGESCSAAVLDGEDVIMIAHASPKRIVPISAQIGFRLPAFATSLGRVMLAAQDDRKLDLFLSCLRPKKITKYTIIDKAQLHKTILTVRKNGYALADQEVEIGFRSIAIPLKRGDGRVIAALNVGVHSERTPLKAMHGQYFEKLHAVATELRQQWI
jgi:IclR family transcriptional regulator, pca regulon regulatory protein